MTSTPDARLVEAHDLARAALAEITPPATVGEAAGYTLEDDGVVSLRFANRMPGYPGWFWTVSVGAADPDAEPTVLETELLPGDGALVAPEWVPWATRLADYHAAQAALAAADDAAGDDESVDGRDEDGDTVDPLGDEVDLDDDEDDLDEDDLDDDEDDLDADGSPILHAGDVDGVDIDDLDPDADDLDPDADGLDPDADDLEPDADEADGADDDPEPGDEGDQPSA